MWIDQQSVNQLIMHMNNAENSRDCARDKVMHQGACEMTTPKAGAATSQSARSHAARIIGTIADQQGSLDWIIGLPR